MTGVGGQPAQTGAGQTPSLGGTQGTHPTAVGTDARPSLDLDHQQALRFGQNKIQLTPTAVPVALDQPPATLLQQSQHPLFGPTPLKGRVVD
jgi:hypothetical protein